MNKIWLSCIVIFLSSQIVLGEIKDSIGVTKLNDKLHIKYLVSPGETIYGISTKYGVAVMDLLEVNPELENGLKVGQVINIPYLPELVKQTKKGDTESLTKIKVENSMVHKVQPGETLYSLSKKYNVPVNDLLKWNNMDLKVGQEIIVGQKDATSQDKPSTPVAPTEQVKPKIENTNTAEVIKPVTPQDNKVVEKPVVKNVPIAASVYDYDSTMKQVLIIPFDPYLYFSDADDEIAARSNIPRTKVRQIFRRRLNALLDHPGYENIHLLGGRAKDSLSDMNKIYSSVTYNYQDALYNPNYVPKDLPIVSGTKKNSPKNWLAKQKDKIIAPEEAAITTEMPKETGKYFGVIVRNPDLYTYFNNKYSADYYIFINQFEVKTNYENCLDRAAQNYERTFTTHFSIFDNTGKQIAGNKFKTHYNSNSNNVMQIVGDNMQQIADRILAELPSPGKDKSSSK